MIDYEKMNCYLKLIEIDVESLRSSFKEIKSYLADLTKETNQTLHSIQNIYKNENFDEIKRFWCTPKEQERERYINKLHKCIVNHFDYLIKDITTRLNSLNSDFEEMENHESKGYCLFIAQNCRGSFFIIKNNLLITKEFLMHNESVYFFDSDKFNEMQELINSLLNLSSNFETLDYELYKFVDNLEKIATRTSIIDEIRFFSEVLVDKPQKNELSSTN